MFPGEGQTAGGGAGGIERLPAEVAPVHPLPLPAQAVRNVLPGIGFYNNKKKKNDFRGQFTVLR